MSRFYDEATGDPNPDRNAARDFTPLTQHIGEWWGEGTVWHEIASEYVHIDVHAVPPTLENPYQMLITTGMSDRPMIVPDGMEAYQYCELLMALPASWPLEQPDLAAEKNYWPLRHLKQTARFPHVFESWLWYGHTISNGNELSPVDASAPFVGFALSLPFLCGEGARKRIIRDGKVVNFFALIPVYEAELRFAWKHGTPELLKRLYDGGVTELVRVGRPCVITGQVPNAIDPSVERPSLTQRLQRWWTARS